MLPEESISESADDGGGLFIALRATACRAGLRAAEAGERQRARRRGGAREGAGQSELGEGNLRRLILENRQRR